MKTMRYLLSVIVILSAMTLSAQNISQLPAVNMQSTSTMIASGSSLPQAAVSGTSTTYDSPAFGPHRAKFDVDPFGEQTIDDVKTPDQPGTPVGDGMWTLLFFAALFTLWKGRRTYRNELG